MNRIQTSKIWAVLLTLILVLLTAGCAQNTIQPDVKLPQGEGLATFANQQQLVQYIEDNQKAAELLGYYGWGRGFMRTEVLRDQSVPLGAGEGVAPTATKEVANDSGGGSADYSKTNVQVDGVDEADVVKTDGKYIYLVSAGKVFILDAYPPGNAKVLSRINNEKEYAQNIFINGDKLVVMGHQYQWEGMFARIYDISDRKNPKSVKEITTRGMYSDSRMVGSYAYIIVTTPVHRYHPWNNTVSVDLPQIAVNGIERTVQPNEIYHFCQPDYGYNYTQILAVDIDSTDNEVGGTTYLTGISQNIYASDKNLYLTNSAMPDFIPLVERMMEELSDVLPEKVKSELAEIGASDKNVANKIKLTEEVLNNYTDTLNKSQLNKLEAEFNTVTGRIHDELRRVHDNTTIHKISVSGEEVNYLYSGKVPGRVLNQFSMDEYKGYFRIATTTGDTFSETNPSKNNVYILNEKLEITGKVEGLAPTERIYSARFMGDRGYMVTFRDVDPLYVIDLKDPHNPKVLGELKIPGYSSYLHPYDENHLIGIGKEIEEPDTPTRPGAIQIFPGPNQVRDLGVKVSLFDVSDPTNPREIDKFVVGGDGYSDSEALWNHKSVLFSRDKNLLVIPVSHYPPFRIMPEMPSGNFKDEHWSGVYVFDISTAGIKLRGKLAHDSGSYNHAINRSLYIEDILYTLSENSVMMHKLRDLKEVKKIDLQHK